MTNKLRNFFIAVLPIVLLGLPTEASAQAKDIECNKCVDSGDVAKGAITNGKIAKNAVTNSKIRSNAITSDKIKKGAVTPAKVAPKLKNSIDTTCIEGSVVIGKDSSGRFICESVRVQSDENLHIIRGNFLTEGGILNGWGYTLIKRGVGDYRVDFLQPFAGRPALTYSTNSPVFVVTTILEPNYVVIEVKDSAGTNVDLQNSWISFIAVGNQ